jgi:hypothetical protein
MVHKDEGLNGFWNIRELPVKEGARPHRVVMTNTHHQMVLDTWYKNMYGLGVGISIVFEIFINFPFLGVGLTPGALPNVLHILSVTQGTRIYTVYGWGSQ